jgi:uroporphyrinogen decarboxylase
MIASIANIGNVGYYTRGLPKDSLAKVKKIEWAGIGIDTTCDLVKTLKTHTNGFVQGNFDEHHLLLESKLFHYELDKWLEQLTDVNTTGWVCGLGHGIGKTTPTANVKYFVDKVRSHFA